MVTTSVEKDKYKLILQAAIEVISEKGMHNASISDIVKRANVAQGTFYLYFRSKNELIPAIAQNLVAITMNRITAPAQESSDYWDFLKVFIQEIYSTTDEYKELIVLVYSGLAFDHSMEIWESIYQPYYEWFENRLKQAIQQEQIIKELNIKWYSKMIINLVENAAERFFIGQDQDMTKEQSMGEVFHFIQRSMKLG